VQQKEKWPRTCGAKFEQGGFTSGRRKDPKTLFPGENPGTGKLAVASAKKLFAANHRVPEIWSNRMKVTTGNFAGHICKKRNPLGGADSILPQRDFSRLG
jgi:hypothetical protein